MDFEVYFLGLGFFTTKTNSSGLRYEVALNILTGDICWINGPFLPGEWNDLEIFCSGLMTFERVEADDGYIGEAPLRVCCPGCVTCPHEKKKMMAIVRSRQETVNKRFKQWGILVQTYRHDIVDHRDVFAGLACGKTHRVACEGALQQIVGFLFIAQVEVNLRMAQAPALEARHQPTCAESGWR